MPRFRGMPEVRAVFVFEGYANDLSVHRSIEDAASSAEVYDLDTLTFLTDDGTVLRAGAQEYRVILTLTDEQRRDELVDRLQRFAERTQRHVPAGSESDPFAYAVLLRAPGWHRK
jgi:hypothetical protein